MNNTYHTTGSLDAAVIAPEDKPKLCGHCGKVTQRANETSHRCRNCNGMLWLPYKPRAINRDPIEPMYPQSARDIKGNS